MPQHRVQLQQYMDQPMEPDYRMRHIQLHRSIRHPVVLLQSYLPEEECNLTYRQSLQPSKFLLDHCAYIQARKYQPWSP